MYNFLIKNFYICIAIKNSDRQLPEQSSTSTSLLGQGLHAKTRRHCDECAGCRVQRK